jgi:uroporphyrinogen decarboxylase
MPEDAAMTKKERVRLAVSHQQPDVVPWSVELTAAARQQIAAWYSDERLKDLDYYRDWMGNHLRYVEPWRMGFHELVEELRPGIWRDKLGIVWDTRGLYGEGEWGRPIHHPLTESSLAGYAFPEPPGPEAFAEYPAFIARHSDCFLMGPVGSCFEPAWGLRGMENLLTDMIQNPGFVDNLLDHLTAYFMAIIDQVVQLDVDACAFGDDWGSQVSLIMGPRLWRQFIKPRMARMFARVKEAGKFVSLHSDGQVSAVFDDLIEIGLDIYNPLQPEILDIWELKKRYGERLCFWGGVGLQEMLLTNTPDGVRQDVGRLIEELGAGGGYILAQAHPDGILADVPVENIVALLETVKEQES